MVIKLLPIRADAPGESAQEVAGRMRHLHPRHNAITGVVGDLVQIVPVRGLGRTDELVAQIELPGCRTPRQADHRQLRGCSAQ